MSKEKIEQTKKAALVIFFAVAAFLSAWYKFVSPLEKPFHWLEEETSLKKKLEVVKKSKTAGVAFWKLGFERAVTWTTIADAVRGW